VPRFRSLDDRQVAGLRVLDEEISLPVADINTRAVLGEATLRLMSGSGPTGR